MAKSWHNFGVINETLRQFAPLSDILQRVATRLMCGGIIVMVLLQNFSLIILIVKQLEKRLIFDKVKKYKTLCELFRATL